MSQASRSHALRFVGLAAAVRWTRENMIVVPGFMATFPEFHMMITPGEE